MLKKVVSVYDTKACYYSPPMVESTVASAQRLFSQIANDKSTTIGQNPADFILFEIGTFDDGSGKIVSLPVPVNLGLASDYVAVRVAPVPVSEVNGTIPTEVLK